MNYDELTKAQLIQLLNERDQQIQQLMAAANSALDVVITQAETIALFEQHVQQQRYHPNARAA
jgi:ABC-type transporter Mla subunit MlaD